MAADEERRRRGARRRGRRRHRCRRRGRSQTRLLASAARVAQTRRQTRRGATAAQPQSRPVRAATPCPPRSSRSSQRWSTRCPATTAGSTNSSTTACGCCAAAMATTCAASRATASTGLTRWARSSTRWRNSNSTAPGSTASSSSPTRTAARISRCCSTSLEQGRLEELQFCVFDLLYCERRGPARPAAVATQGPARRRVRQTTRATGRCAWPTRSTATARSCWRASATSISRAWSPRRSTRPTRAIAPPNWLKIKCHREQEFVVGGAAFLPGRGTGTFSSLLVGVKSGKGLKYVGPRRRRLRCRRSAPSGMRACEQARAEGQSVRSTIPDKRSGEIWHWMKPKLVIQVAFAGLDAQAASCASRAISACARIAIRRPWCAKNRRIPRTW